MKKRTLISTIAAGILASSAMLAGPAAGILAGSAVLAGPAAASVGAQQEINCLALNIYHEARGEPVRGMIAVGHVVMNRVLDSQFPTDVCTVVAQGGERRHRCQFSWWCDGRRDSPVDVKSWEEVKALARSIYFGKSVDPTCGALWYHADYVKPYWKNAYKEGPTIGRHIFYCREKGPAIRPKLNRYTVQMAMTGKDVQDAGETEMVAPVFGWVMSVRPGVTKLGEAQ